jgi:hypothetical protein
MAGEPCTGKTRARSKEPTVKIEKPTVNSRKRSHSADPPPDKRPKSRLRFSAMDDSDNHLPAIPELEEEEPEDAKQVMLDRSYEILYADEDTQYNDTYEELDDVHVVSEGAIEESPPKSLKPSSKKSHVPKRKEKVLVDDESDEDFETCGEL